MLLLSRLMLLSLTLSSNKHRTIPIQQCDPTTATACPPHQLIPCQSNNEPSTSSWAMASILQHDTPAASSLFSDTSPTFPEPHVSALANIPQAATSRSWLGLIGVLALLFARVIPALLYWLVTFTSITLPTFLFNLFSTSLTFTMNFTTL